MELQNDAYRLLQSLNPEPCASYGTLFRGMMPSTNLTLQRLFTLNAIALIELPQDNTGMLR